MSIQCPESYHVYFQQIQPMYMYYNQERILVSYPLQHQQKTQLRQSFVSGNRMKFMKLQRIGTVRAKRQYVSMLATYRG